jgi:hypothetical protein
MLNIQRPGMDESPGMGVADEEPKESCSPAQAVSTRKARTPTAALTTIIPPLSSNKIYFMVGITNSAPSFVPVGQRDVTVLVLV